MAQRIVNIKVDQDFEKLKKVFEILENYDHNYWFASMLLKRLSVEDGKIVVRNGEKHIAWVRKTGDERFENQLKEAGLEYYVE